MKKLKNYKVYRGILMAFSLISLVVLYQCNATRKMVPESPVETIRTHPDANGTDLTITFIKGPEHNHPLMAVWLETTQGKYIETLYVAKSIAKGIFQHGDKSSGKWEPGPIRRPAALPYWSHKRGVRASDGLYIPEQSNPMPDAVTGATPQKSFILQTTTSDKIESPVRILFEINQSWDWNEYWTNNKYPDDPDYKTSSQPALVYMTTIDPSYPDSVFVFKPIGHSHFSGKDGSLDENIGTLTTALEIASRITASFPHENK